MKAKITPCLWFDNQAKEAGAFYCALLANAKIVAQSPIITEIEVSGQTITLLDGGPKYKPNASISFFYICETEEEIDHIWEAFSKGGSVLMPLDRYEWSEKYGWLNDKFGISWQFALGKLDTVGQAEEALRFYSAVFKDSKTDGILYNKQNNKLVEHAQFELLGQKFMIMDSTKAHSFSFNEAVSLTIHCETQNEIDYYWEKLTAGGAESMCGWLKDKFGVSWQVVPTILGKIMSDPNKAGKAAQAFMQMRKFDIEQIVQASLK
jgi:predicted 3-demethylubiquinone-9 3-methyltransferase (glyoxalase superfamily)